MNTKDWRAHLEAAVQKLSVLRQTFTEEEAFAEAWEASYNLSPQDDSRFILGHEADGSNPRHWHLAGQVVANNRLIESLNAGTWDGRALKAELERLDQECGGHHVFCPVDRRLTVYSDGRIAVTEDERDVGLPDEIRISLESLADGLLKRWLEGGPVPWTVQQVTAHLADLGWERAHVRGAWRHVRSWLRGWSAVTRVGQDYWVPGEGIPTGPTRTRLNVICIREPQPTSTENQETEPPSFHGGMEPPSDAIPEELTTVLAGARTRWTVALRTVHLTEGFLKVPSEVRSAYPPAPLGGGLWEMLRGQWFETGEQLWVWLDREHHLLCGPDLAEQLAWREAGERLEVTWTADLLVFRPNGIDTEVQREETRLADVETLATLRGGLGESYRRSIAAVLAEQPSGLPFRDLVDAVRQRQGHEVHRGTLRAVLHAGGFLCHDGRWQVAPEQDQSRRRFREAVVRATALPPDKAHGTRSPQASLAELAVLVAERCRNLRDQLSG